MAKATTAAPAPTPAPAPVIAASAVVVGADSGFKFNPEAMRKRFHDITAIKANIRTASAPLRAKYEALRNTEQEIQLQQRPIRDEMLKIEGPLFDLSNEQAFLARALGGQTGEDPTIMAQILEETNSKIPEVKE